MSGFQGENGSGGDPKLMMVNRMHARHAMLIDAFRHAIADSTVLHLGAEDGRWCYTFAAAGALQVVGVEGNPHMAARFDGYPDVGLRERIELRASPPFVELAAEVAAERRYDIVAIFDVLEEAADLAETFKLFRGVHPRLVICDGMVSGHADPVLRLVKAVGEERFRLRPSPTALELMARDAGFDLEWMDWSLIPEDGRLGLDDYFSQSGSRRASFILTPLRAG